MVKDEISVQREVQPPKVEGVKYNGLYGTTKTIISEEGAHSLFNGLTAGLHRQIIFSGIRVGMYLPVRDFVCGEIPEGQNPALY